MYFMQLAENNIQATKLNWTDAQSALPCKVHLQIKYKKVFMLKIQIYYSNPEAEFNCFVQTKCALQLGNRI